MALSSLIDSCGSSIIALTETWLNNTIPDNVVLVCDSVFNLFRCDRGDRRGGGVLLAIKKEITAVLIDVTSCIESVWVRLKCGPTDAIIGVIYRPPNMSTSFSSELCLVLSELTVRFPSSSLLILGDFNFPVINWSSLTAPGSDPEAQAFLQCCLDFSLQQLISEPTRRSATSANVLDLILTNNPYICSNIAHLEGLSDHSIITGNVNFVPHRKSTRTKQIRCYNRANFGEINAELAVFAEHFLHDFRKRSVEANWNLFSKKLAALVDKYIPIISIPCTNTAPWFNSHLRRLNNKKKRLYRQADLNRQSDSWQRYKACDKEYQSALISTRRHFFSHDLPSMLTNNPRKFWQTINPSNKPDITLTDAAGDSIPAAECAEVFNKAFTSVFTREEAFLAPNTMNISNTSMSEIIISETGILSLLTKLKTSSASDHLGFNNKILVNSSEGIHRILSAIFSQSLSSGFVPSDWRLAKVVPIFKSGDRSLPLNYRPISLTSTVCKLLEHVIHSQVINYLEEHNIIFKYQHGFRKGYSCETQLAGFIQDLHSSVDAGIQVDSIFLDFSKAFDRVPHNRLLTKLALLNIHPLVLAWVKHFLSSRFQFTTVNNHNSSFSQVHSGVPQGSVLGPLLFLIFINDLPNSVSSQIRLFADDCVIYRNIYSNDDRLALQHDIDSVTAWCSTWLMQLNPSKTKCMSFTNRKSRIPTAYTLNNNPLELVTTYKYLGVHIYSDLTWNHHINLTVASVNRSLGLLKHNLKHAPSHLRSRAYTTLIRPKIEYASAIWDPHQAYLINSIESLQNRAVRFIYSDYSRHTSITALKKRAGFQELSLRRKIARLSLFHKLYHHSTLHNDFFCLPSAIFDRRDHPFKVKRVSCRSFNYAHSFIPRTITDWNALPPRVATTTDHDKFLNLLSASTTA